MRRREFITVLGGAAAAWPLVVHAQASKNIPRLCFLTFDPVTSRSTRFDAFFRGLVDLGYMRAAVMRGHGVQQKGDYLSFILLLFALYTVAATGKTFIVFDLAAALGTGQPFLGHAVKRRCGVLLIAAEGADEVRLRLALDYPRRLCTIYPGPGLNAINGLRLMCGS